MQVRNSRDLIAKDPKIKILIYGLPGIGKSMWGGNSPNPGIIACETGTGSGMLSVSSLGVDFVEPTNLDDVKQVIDGKIFGDKETIILDSLSEMAKTFIKEYALKLPRQKGDSPKRRIGIPELDDYGSMGELTRNLLRHLLGINKHIIVTATEKYKENEDVPGETRIGPDLPGAMFEGATAMFDYVFRLRVRSKLRNPNDATSRYMERYFITQPDRVGSIVKCRANVNGKSVLPAEIIYDLESGRGTFNDVLEQIKGANTAKQL